MTFDIHVEVKHFLETYGKKNGFHVIQHSLRKTFARISSLCLSVHSGRGISERFEKNRVYEGSILFLVNIPNVHGCGMTGGNGHCIYTTP
ncbi:hypothetical protein PBRA_005035 [Plasmodiophora brassicae]|uniref:Uncharacterized protein n=1 Tax=Plasmodiophora brassicae TaxID=37360 RepID=A0A0G4IMJ0_PLABS|nr:hypothetical protein PBRA_005035 [Plasmodiophora brassicae]